MLPSGEKQSFMVTCRHHTELNVCDETDINKTEN